VLADCRKCSVPYFDDIIIASGDASDSWEEAAVKHLGDLEMVFAALEKGSMFVDPNKARLFLPKVELCGYILENRT
jgi:hypothetical protein